MTKARLSSLFISFVLFSCKLPTVAYFTTQPFIKAYQREIDKSMTIVLDPNVPDSMIIKSAGLKKMTVSQFRQTLEDALKNTFKTTYASVSFGYKPSDKGISLVLIKVLPDWHKKSARTIVTGNQGYASSSTSYELQAKVNYQAVVYSEGERAGVVEGDAFSEKSTFKRGETPEVFQDGIKVLCEEIYKQTIAFK